MRTTQAQRIRFGVLAARHALERCRLTPDQVAYLEGCEAAGWRVKDSREAHDREVVKVARRSGRLLKRLAECNCCGPWLVESNGLLSEFASEDEADEFYGAERIRRLAAIHGITDSRRIEGGVAALRRIRGK